MNSTQFSAFLILINALDKTLSFSKFKIQITLESDEEVRRAVDELIKREIPFKLTGTQFILYRGQD